MSSSLARYLPTRPADESQLFAMRRAAWIKEGIAVIRPDDLTDDWQRQSVINAATKLYGARRSEVEQGADKIKNRGG